MSTCIYENELVYDPFMGSGTTAKMALLNNRKFVGSEISKEYCEIAEKRINDKITEASGYLGARGGRKKKNQAENTPVESNEI
jgi:DNA modification methylase